MQKHEAQNIIESTFNASFSEKKFTLFIKNLLNDIDTTRYNEYHGQYIKDAFKEHIKQYKRIGKYTDPNGDALDVLIVEVKDQTKLDKTRTALRNFVINHLDSFEKDYALVAFYSNSDHGADWRFSFVKLEYKTEVKEGKLKQSKELTPAKRYSFLVGVHEKAYTAKKQLLPLLENIYNNPTLEELEEAFSIEKVTDEFFEQYKSLFLILTNQFEKDKNDPIAIGLKEQLALAGIDIPRFTKKLLGQIVFLYFLQKKGWLGVPKNEKWGRGEKKYIQKLYKDAEENGKNFFGDYLQHLFYNALAHKHSDEGIKGYYKKLGCKVPFLNGGLFEADYKWEESHITIPNHLFRNKEKINKTGDVGTGVLDVFDRYNFTIKEDEPLEKEVAVDPEMLGKVFENMLEVSVRKSQGAFYTPREIVHYMCQESLIHYLDNALNTYAKTWQELGNSQTNLFGNAGKRGQQSLMQEQEQVLVPKDDIDIFIRKGFFALENDQRILLKGKETPAYTFKLPESVRLHANLLDNKLADIKVCDPAIGSGAFPVGMLHEIVNARLVLRQYLKNFKNQANPDSDNYAYHLKRHTIQESIYGVDIDASAIDIARLRLWLSLVVDEEDLDNIEALPNLDYKIVCGNSLIGFPENWKSPAFTKLENLKNEFFLESDTDKKRQLKREIDQQIKERLDGSERVFGYKVEFDFRLFFSEVWHKKGGFDIVIGNPPYISISKSPDKNELKKVPYETYIATGDLYLLFYEKGNSLLKKKGNLCFITSNKWLNASYGAKTRNFFITKTNPIVLIDFAKIKIFPKATVFVNILMFENEKFKNELVATYVDGTHFPKISIEDYFDEHKIKLDNLSEDICKINSQKGIQINVIIEKRGIPLKNWKNIDFFRGVTTGLNTAFHITDKQKNNIIQASPKCAEIIKPLLRGKDIKRWNYDYHNLHIIFTRQGIDMSSYQAIESHLNAYYDELIPKKSISQKIGRKPGRYKWYEIQDNTAYYYLFDKPKIIWIEISDRANYAYDKSGYYLTNSAYFISGKNLKYLVAILNSSIADFYFFQITAKIAGGRKRYTKQYVEQVPIPQISKKQQSPFEILVDYTLISKKQKLNLMFSYFEQVLDAAVFDLYFDDKLKSAGKEILKYLGDLKPINDDMSDEEKLAIIQSEFGLLYDPNHPVRNNVETLDSVEEVKIIKEALK